MVVLLNRFLTMPVAAFSWKMALSFRATILTKVLTLNFLF